MKEEKTVRKRLGLDRYLAGISAAFASQLSAFFEVAPYLDDEQKASVTNKAFAYAGIAVRHEIGVYVSSPEDLALLEYSDGVEVGRSMAATAFNEGGLYVRPDGRVAYVADLEDSDGELGS